MTQNQKIKQNKQVIYLPVGSKDNATQLHISEKVQSIQSRKRWSKKTLLKN